MQIKRFEARSMTEALRRIKTEFGPEAVILSARSLKNEAGLFGQVKKAGVVVTAATDALQEADGQTPRHQAEPSRAPLPKRKVTSRRPMAPLVEKAGAAVLSRRVAAEPSEPPPARPAADRAQRLRQELLSAGVKQDYAEAVTAQLRGTGSADFRSGLEEALGNMGLAFRPLPETGAKKRIIALVGMPGAGKTTTAAKLAAMYAMGQARKVGLLSLDECRIGARNQLELLARIIGIPFAAADGIKQLRPALNQLRPQELVVVDTPGIAPQDTEQLESLRRSLQRLHPDEVHLVLPCTYREEILAEAVIRFKPCGVNRLSFTRLDESPGWSAVVNTALETRLPLAYFADGQQEPEHLSRASLEALLARLLSGDFLRALAAGERTAEAAGSSAAFAAPPGQPAAEYVANSHSDVFHCPGCKSARRIKPQNLIVFHSYEEALSRGLNPCRVCRPDRAEGSAVLARYQRQSKIANYH